MLNEIYKWALSFLFLHNFPISDLTISFTVGFLYNNQFGLLGQDIYFADWAKDLIYFSNAHKNYYAFLIDMTGR